MEIRKECTALKQKKNWECLINQDRAKGESRKFRRKQITEDMGRQGEQHLRIDKSSIKY